MTEMFEDICFRFMLGERDEDESLLLQWGVMQTPFEWSISLDGVVDRHSYKFVATDLDTIVKVLKDEPALSDLHLHVVHGSTIKFKPNRLQQMLFKVKFCGEELVDD